MVYGVFSVYSEARVHDGRIEGYVKPIFRDLKVYGKDKDEDRTFGQKVKEKAIDVAAKILCWFYPVLVDNATHSLERQLLKAKVVSIREGVVRVALDGTAKVRHWNYFNKAEFSFIDSTFAGFVDYDRAQGKIIRFRIATEKGSHGKSSFGIAVRSVP